MAGIRLFARAFGVFSGEIDRPGSKEKCPRLRRLSVCCARSSAFMAIANYKNNFYGERPRLLPVSLVMITCLAYIMGIYFTNIVALMKIGGFMFFVAAALSGYGNWLPQVEGGFPPPEVKLDFQSMTPQQLAMRVKKSFLAVLAKVRSRGLSGRANVPCAMGSIRDS